jgi:hypothetical protein
MITVKATREGLLGGKTSTGYIVDKFVPFVALPCADALDEVVRIINPLTGKCVLALVMDVGPFNVNDQAYVFHGARPQAESGISVSGHGTNGAGIDLGEFVWNKLGMKDNTSVSWEFISCL